MDLTHLDDVQPPVPDAAMRGHVVKTARSRRRTRVGLESAAALIVVAAIVVAGVAATHGPGRHVRVAVTAPASSTTVAPADVTVQIELDHDTVAPGGTISGHVIFDNPTTRTMTFPHVTGPTCLAQYQVRADTETPTGVGWPLDCTLVRPGPSSPPLTNRAHGYMGDLIAPPGLTSVPFSTGAYYSSCVQYPTDSPRHCLAHGGLPPLPKGRAYVYFLLAAGPLPHLATPAPVPITIK